MAFPRQTATVFLALRGREPRSQVASRPRRTQSRGPRAIAVGVPPTTTTSPSPARPARAITPEANRWGLYQRLELAIEFARKLGGTGEPRARLTRGGTGEPRSRLTRGGMGEPRSRLTRGGRGGPGAEEMLIALRGREPRSRHGPDLLLEGGPAPRDGEQRDPPDAPEGEALAALGGVEDEDPDLLAAPVRPGTL